MHLQAYCIQGSDIIVEEKVCFEIVSPRNVRKYIHKVPPTWLPKHDLNKDNTNKHANVDSRELMRPQSHTQNSKQLRNEMRVKIKCSCPREGQAETLQVGHILVAIHRLIEMG